MKVSVCSASYGPGPILPILDRVAALGFDGVELTVMYHLNPFETTAQVRRQIKHEIATRGLDVSALHFIYPPGLNFTSDDPAERRKVSDHLVTVLQLAAEMEAPVVVAGGGGARSIPKAIARQEGERRISEIFRDAAERGRDLGVTLAFEALNRYETNFGNTLEECARFVDEVDAPGLGVAGDTYHMNIEELRLDEAIKAVGTKLSHLHLADNHRLAPGDGHVDFGSVLSALESINYAGYVSFELFWITPQLLYLPTFELCDREVARAIAHVKTLLGRQQSDRD